MSIVQADEYRTILDARVVMLQYVQNAIHVQPWCRSFRTPSYGTRCSYAVVLYQISGRCFAMSTGGRLDDPFRHDSRAAKQMKPFLDHSFLYAMPSARIFCRFFNVNMLASKNRSTQFFMHVSSVLSSWPCRMLPVMHFLKHMSVREWTAMSRGNLC
jgi:hypothetical protein